GEAGGSLGAVGHQPDSAGTVDAPRQQGQHPPAEAYPAYARRRLRPEYAGAAAQALDLGEHHSVVGDHQDLRTVAGDLGQRQKHRLTWLDRKSTRLNSSHVSISYAVFCLKKKKKA